MTNRLEARIVVIGEKSSPQLPSEESERQQRANAPTLRDLRQAAAELASAVRLTNQPTGNSVDVRLTDGH